MKIMNKVLKLTMIICLLLSSFGASAVIGPKVDTLSSNNKKIGFETTFTNIRVDTKQEKELSFREKLTLKFIKWKFKKLFPADEEVKFSSSAIGGFVLGLVSLFIAGIILGGFAIFFSARALSKIKKSPETVKGKGLAIAGLVLGIIGVLGALYVLTVLG